MRNNCQSAKPSNFLLMSIIWATLIFWSTTRASPANAAGSNFYVSTTGTPTGTGSIGDPLDLATALGNSSPAGPGDTIWLRDGTYTGIFSSNLNGTAANPIIVRSYPGEWAVIDTQAQNGAGDNFRVYGSWVYYRDFELMNSRTSNRSGNGFGFLGSSQDNKFINLIVHDLGNNTFRDGNEIYGSILYNNGVDGSGQAHHLYTQNTNASNPVRLTESIIFNSFAFGVHGYAGGSGQLNGIHLTGNVWFNNGLAQTSGNCKDNVLISGDNDGTENILLNENMGWAPSSTTRSVALGRYNGPNKDITLTNNYLGGDTIFENAWQSVTMTGNTFYQLNSSNSSYQISHPSNTYLTTAPTGAKVFIRPNQYESGRAHIVVYNWNMADTVDVDVSSVLNNGDIYQVRNAQNYFAPPVIEGIYQGNLLTLPMTGLDPVQSIGSGLIEASEMTGKAFNVFVLMKSDAKPALTLTKAVDNKEPTLGQRITYTITVKNNGNISTANAFISDTLPMSITFAGPVTLNPPQPNAILATTAQSLPVVASNVTITALTSITLTLPVTVNLEVNTSTLVINTAAVTSPELSVPARGSVSMGGMPFYLPLILKNN